MVIGELDKQLARVGQHQPRQQLLCEPFQWGLLKRINSKCDIHRRGKSWQTALLQSVSQRGEKPQWVNIWIYAAWHPAFLPYWKHFNWIMNFNRGEQKWLNIKSNRARVSANNLTNYAFVKFLIYLSNLIMHHKMLHSVQHSNLNNNNKKKYWLIHKQFQKVDFEAG